MKRSIAVLLTAALLVCALAVPIFAAEDTPDYYCFVWGEGTFVPTISEGRYRVIAFDLSGISYDLGFADVCYNDGLFDGGWYSWQVFGAFGDLVDAVLAIYVDGDICTAACGIDNDIFSCLLIPESNEFDLVLFPADNFAFILATDVYFPDEEFEVLFAFDGRIDEPCVFSSTLVSEDGLTWRVFERDTDFFGVSLPVEEMGFYFYEYHNTFECDALLIKRVDKPTSIGGGVTTAISSAGKVVAALFAPDGAFFFLLPVVGLAIAMGIVGWAIRTKKRIIYR